MMEDPAGVSQRVTDAAYQSQLLNICQAREHGASLQGRQSSKNCLFPRLPPHPGGTGHGVGPRRLKQAKLRQQIQATSDF